MALQKINWTQIDTAVVPSGTTIDLGALSEPLHAVYAENLYISGQSIGDFVADSGTDELNQFSASVKQALEFTGSNVTIKGDLLVKGTMTAIESNVVSIGDNVLELNGSEATFGGLLIKDPTNPNKISGSLLWDTTNDYWIAGPLGQEEKIILQSDLDSSSIWQETGSFYATTNDLQVTGSMVIKGDLRVEGTTTLVQTLDAEAQSLIISGAASIVRNEMVSASLSIQNLGILADRSTNSVIDCGDGFF
jgi:cytoskeletal protein CcmA (bactofilin family)